MSNIATFKPSELPQGIPGFIDETGIRDLLWVEQNLGSKLKFAAGKCPNCGAGQFTIYTGFTSTNCLTCGQVLSLTNEVVRKKQILFEIAPVYDDCDIIEDSYEPITEESLKRALSINFHSTIDFKYPEPNMPWVDLYKRIKNYFREVISIIKNKFK